MVHSSSVIYCSFSHNRCRISNLCDWFLTPVYIHPPSFLHPTTFPAVSPPSALSGSHLTADTVTNSYADENHVAVAVSKCVLARAGDGHVIWALAPCERKSSFMCTRPAAPEGKYGYKGTHINLFLSTVSFFFYLL